MILKKRLIFEFKSLRHSIPKNCQFFLKSSSKQTFELTQTTPDKLIISSDLSQLTVTFHMPRTKFYSPGTAQIHLNLGDYPMAKPTVKIQFDYLHPGIDSMGQICPEIFSDLGSDSFLSQYICRILEFLVHPDKAEILNPEAAQWLLKRNLSPKSE